MRDDLIRLTYDAESDVLGIWLPGPPGRTVKTIVVKPWIHVDVDASGGCAGIDILDAKHQIPLAALRKLPRPESWSTLSEAAKESGLSANTLRVLVNRGRIEARKQGRDWLVDDASLWNYLEAREARGRPPASMKGRRIRAKMLRSN
jgi:uncharacterized protein YuzE